MQCSKLPPCNVWVHSCCAKRIIAVTLWRPAIGVFTSDILITFISGEIMWFIIVVSSAGSSYWDNHPLKKIYETQEVSNEDFPTSSCPGDLMSLSMYNVTDRSTTAAWILLSTRETRSLQVKADEGIFCMSSVSRSSDFPMTKKTLHSPHRNLGIAVVSLLSIGSLLT